MKDAKNARNYIAHDAGVEIRHEVGARAVSNTLLSELEGAVRTIARANLVVLYVSNIETHEPNPRIDYLEKYVDRVVDWVCDIEE